MPLDQTYAYYPNGRLQTYTGPDGTKTYVYEPAASCTTSLCHLNGQNEAWVFDYDAMGRSSTVTYPDGHKRDPGYDPEGRLQSRCYKYGADSHCYTATYDPTATRRPDRSLRGSRRFEYDALNRLKSVTRTVNGVTEHVETYTYNAIGAVKTTFDPLASPGDPRRPATRLVRGGDGRRGDTQHAGRPDRGAQRRRTGDEHSTVSPSPTTSKAVRRAPSTRAAATP